MTNNPFTHLSDEHYEDLKKSGHSDETIQEAGIKSVRPGDINKIFGYETYAKSCYEIPYSGTDCLRYKIFMIQLTESTQKLVMGDQNTSRRRIRGTVFTFPKR